MYYYITIQVFSLTTAVQFLNDTSTAYEFDGFISFTVISLVPFDKPFSVQVCTRESNPQSAEGLLILYVYFTPYNYKSFNCCRMYVIHMHPMHVLFAVSLIMYVHFFVFIPL